MVRKMSGGRLVVLGHGSRRDVYPLSNGMATLGSAKECDICVMLPTVRPHHATVAVHRAQTVIINEGDAETLVNGQSVSVAALEHGDVIKRRAETVPCAGCRYSAPAPTLRQQATPGGPPLLARVPSREGGLRRGSLGTAPSSSTRDRHPPAIEMTHHASMPASSDGKQVALIQPQRKDTDQQTGTEDS